MWLASHVSPSADLAGISLAPPPAKRACHASLRWLRAPHLLLRQAHLGSPSPPWFSPHHSPPLPALFHTACYLPCPSPPKHTPLETAFTTTARPQLPSAPPGHQQASQWSLHSHPCPLQVSTLVYDFLGYLNGRIILFYWFWNILSHCSNDASITLSPCSF